MKKNDIYKIEIESWSSEGEGICHIDGMAVFVRGGVPGDRCSIRIIKVLKSRAIAIIEEMISPSGSRIENDCPVFNKCGGCVLRHVSYEEELRMKYDRVEGALKRIGKVETPVEAVLPSPAIYGYRNKVIFQTSEASGGPVVGFYRRGSHDVLSVDACLLQEAGANRVADVVRRFALEHKVPMYNERSGEGIIRYIFYRASSLGTAQVCIVSAKESFKSLDQLVDILRKECPELTGILLCYNPHKGNVALTDDIRVLWGNMYLTDKLCGLTFRISPLSFYQVNHDQTENLYKLVLEFAGLSGNETVFDLYCGIGTISLMMTRHAGKVIGVEIVPQAVEDAKANGELNGITNAEFICTDAVEAANIMSTRGERIDVVAIDPPRKGLSADAINAILRIAPARIIYVSCDPATLARDLNIFEENGYKVQRVKPVDMFPRTSHVECVVLMSRNM